MDIRGVKSVRMIKLLLEHPDGSLTRYGLAKSSETSQPYGVKMIQKLEAKELVAGTRVLDMERLARYGVELLPHPVLVVEMYHAEPLEFLKRYSKKYALTTYFAENRLTHHLFPFRCDVYVTMPELEKLTAHIKKEGLLGAGNMRFMIPADDRVIKESQNIRGVHVVSIGQLMMDLVKEGGVCMEAFEMLVERRVRKG